MTVSNKFILKIRSLFLFTMLFFIFFPYVKIPVFNIQESDLQPYSFILSIFFILSSLTHSFLTSGELKLHQYSISLLFFCFYVLCISFLLDSFNIRNFYAYLSYTTYVTVGYFIFKKNLLRLRHIYLFAFIYGFSAILQIIFSNDFGVSIVNHFRCMPSNSYRGVCSLTSEPSFYSIQMIFILILFFLLRSNMYYTYRGNIFQKKTKFTKNQILFFLFLIIQTVLFSRAILGLLFVIILLSLLLIVTKKIKLIFFGNFFVLIAIYAIYKGAPQNRITEFLHLVVNNPSKIIMDESVNQRLKDIILSFDGFFGQIPFAFGHGTNSWNLYLHDNAKKFNFLSDNSYMSGKIMSGYGGILFESGILGLFFIIIPYSYYLFKLRNHANKVLGVFIFIFMLGAVQISNPLYGLILGACVYISSVQPRISSLSTTILPTGCA